MNAIKIIIILVLVLSLLRLMRFEAMKTINFKAFIFWSAILIVSIVLFINPLISDKIAHLLGIGRGVDSMFFLAILLLFYLNFQLYMRLQKLDQTLTKLNQKTSEQLHIIVRK